MIEASFGQNNAWQMLNDYAVTYTTNKVVYQEGAFFLPGELRDFFGAEGREKRVLFLYEGRDYPSYIESEGSEGNYRLSLSKALHSKFIGLFPDYDHFFDTVNEYNVGETPILYFEKMDEATFMVKLNLPTDEAHTLKQTLFDFIGPGKSVASFNDSFEILFLKYYLEYVDNRWRSDVFMVSAGVLKFYQGRVAEGHEQDKNAEVTIDNIRDAGLDDVLSFLMEHPYMTYADQGLMAMETVDDHFYFTVENALIDDLSTEDRRFILELLDQKIEYYYERLDGPGLQENLSTLMNEYASFYTKDFRYSFKDVLTEAIPATIGGLRFVPGQRYKVVGFAGDDDWAEIPWVSILDKNITRLTNSGVYIQFLLNKDTQKLYLALSYGFKDEENEILKRGLENEATIKIAVGGAIEEKVKTIQGIVRPGSFSMDSEAIDLPDDRFRLGIICYREYAGAVPGDNILEADLQEMLAVYNEYYERCILKLDYEVEEEEEPEADEPAEESDESDEDVAEDENWDDADEDEEEDDDSDEYDEAEDTSEIDDVENIDDTINGDDDDVPGVLDIATEMASEVAGVPMEPKVEKPAAKSRRKKKKHTASVSAPIDADILKALTQALQTGGAPVSQHLNKRDRSITRDETVQPTPTDVAGTLRGMADYITANGFNCDEAMAQNFFLSLKSKPFVLITGGTGVGKSNFVRLFAEAMGANTDNGRYKQVPVRPDWQDSRGLLGYLDAAGVYVPGAIVDLVADAIDNPTLPFFLCLDEMAVAQIEGYFSEILSVLETRRQHNGRVVTDPILGDEVFGRDDEARNYYNNLYLPSNLLIVGTISSQEARRGISRKVMDRANILEVTQDSLKVQPVPSAMPQAITLGSDFLESEELILAHVSHHREMVQEVVTLLEAMNVILTAADAQIGYKVRDGVCFYLLNNVQYGLMSHENALDHAILQNILPRILGGGEAVESVMTDLFKICAGTRANNAIRNYPGNNGGLFPHSAAKLSYMVKRFDLDGEANFWQ